MFLMLIREKSSEIEKMKISPFEMKVITKKGK